tara:strand:+ start:44 stop:259 length:216 start_codon:yes stop_codon:yes gene_type:complete
MGMTQNVYIYRGKYYYENTLPKEALNRTLDGYNLFKLVNSEIIKIHIDYVIAVKENEDRWEKLLMIEGDEE